ncbi:GNAT family N-acetyltransferase [Pseudomonas sp. PCH199]|uniref:GNAT family N-acetyltransferase n=1 Tax=unclassified Pseudomonas TaxID=196821 RepID=UPI000BDCC618|nr:MULTISPECIES: GNAT family protein [unclassified Pseudomonas]MCW8275247.1 GNAT family N-acetyltransferase [Pseudomonas sp. PCH199]PAM84915.1 GNAT family N-acetyltransferase [Pseudomonas sp. ERMR1:02]
MISQHRLVKADDIKSICSFPLNAQELFYMFPKAQYPLTETQLSNAIAQRFDSTVVETGNSVVGFANFYRAETGGVCCIGNVIAAQEARGKGVATFIVETKTALAFDRYDATEVRISCFNENTAGLLLYPKLGFLPFAVEERISQDSRRSALIHMTRSRVGRP